MKILQIIPVFNPPEFYGGSQQVVYQLSKELSKRGHEVTVFCSDAKRSDIQECTEKKIEVYDGITIHHFINKYPYLSLKFGFFYTPSMKNALMKHKFDIIHLHELRGYQHIITSHMFKKINTPYVIQAHGILGQDQSKPKRLFDYFYRNDILLNAQITLALNRKEQEQYIKAGVPIDKTRIISNGINLSDYEHLPPKGLFKQKYGIPENEQIILFLGRIHYIKGLDVLVKSFANVLKKKNNVTLVLAGGDDGFLAQLQYLINNLNVSNKVIFTGPLAGATKQELMVDADLFVLPSRYEMFPMALLEAYAYGKTVISSAFEGFEDLIIPDSTAIVVKPEDVSGLSNAIYFAVTNNTDLGFNAKNFVTAFSITNICSEVEAIYRSVIKNPA